MTELLWYESTYLYHKLAPVGLSTRLAGAEFSLSAGLSRPSRDLLGAFRWARFRCPPHVRGKSLKFRGSTRAESSLKVVTFPCATGSPRMSRPGDAYFKLLGLTTGHEAGLPVSLYSPGAAEQLSPEPPRPLPPPRSKS